MKLGCAREWGGWGRLSVDGRDSITRTGARAPGVGGAFHRMAVQYIASTHPTLGGSTLKHERRRQTGRRTVYAGSRLKLAAVPGRSRLIRQPSSRNGENPPCGMIGGTMETAASFEVRNAPSSYPTEAQGEIPRADSAGADTEASTLPARRAGGDAQRHGQTGRIWRQAPPPSFH